MERLIRKSQVIISEFSCYINIFLINFSILICTKAIIFISLLKYIIIMAFA